MLHWVIIFPGPVPRVVTLPRNSPRVRVLPVCPVMMIMMQAMMRLVGGFFLLASRLGLGDIDSVMWPRLENSPLSVRLGGVPTSSVSYTYAHAFGIIQDRGPGEFEHRSLRIPDIAADLSYYGGSTFQKKHPFKFRGNGHMKCNVISGRLCHS